MNENDISFLIRGAIYQVYVNLGPGLLESAYISCLVHELKKQGLEVKTEIPMPLIYDSVKMNVGYRLDILVNNKVIVEVKSVEKLAEVHHKQLITYLKLSGLKLGLLTNFNSTDILKSIFRKVNKL